VDLSGFRQQFPALERYVWLDTPTVPPAARPVLSALRRVERAWEAGDFNWRDWDDAGDIARSLFADLIGADPSDVALASSLSEAAATVAHSLPPGRIVVGEREFRSNLYPWLALESRGFEVTLVPSSEGIVTTDALIDALDERTVLIAASEVQSSTGYRVRLTDLAARAREVGARVFIDLAQSLGALRLDVADANPDFVAALGYKWLLCPRGTAWLYVRRDRREEIEPLAPNWKTPADPHATYYGAPLELAPGASRFDASLAWFPWIGSVAALRLLHTLDREAIEHRCLELARAFREGAQDAGFHVVPQDAPSQIVGVDVPDADALRARLREHRVTASVRGGFLRLGFHGFNTEDDVEVALKALGTA
jgi:selenocysteine lyase/cysteine desulfurase